ncbi:hypothetical protein QBC35DRAFT_506592 [Podospora australis]|uniref:Secreted protein n=1 Tax=Podospora australis TaxID=1536484 RepID=A0AAN7AEY4_9PEZI|nr:hypothetical protein QBC35DRAFT_506592 [Podospora australis]
MSSLLMFRITLPNWCCLYFLAEGECLTEHARQVWKACRRACSCWANQTEPPLDPPLGYIRQGLWQITPPPPQQFLTIKRS